MTVSYFAYQFYDRYIAVLTSQRCMDSIVSIILPKIKELRLKKLDLIVT